MVSHSTEIVTLHLHDRDMFICYCPCGVISEPQRKRGSATAKVLPHVLAERRKLPPEGYIAHEDIDWDKEYERD